jgi:hypothetical protein
MGRRHLIRFAVAVAAALVLCASAGAAVQWRLLADGPSAGGVATTKAFVALTLSSAGTQFGESLTRGAMRKLATVDFSRDAVVAVFGEFGCRDSLIDVSTLAQHGKTLSVSLVQRAPKPGTAQCMAIFATYRFLVVPKASLARPWPTRATVSLARA